LREKRPIVREPYLQRLSTSPTAALRRRVVAEDNLDLLGVPAALEEHRGAGMAERVETRPGTLAIPFGRMVDGIAPASRRIGEAVADAR
jgi:hypothetical protein